MNKKFKGKLTIGRWQGNNCQHMITIQLEDDTSHAFMFDVELTPEDFAKAITGCGYMDCMYDIGHTELAGKTHDVKTEDITFKYEGYDRKKWRTAFAEAAKPFEVDGWKVHLEDHNQHRIVSHQDDGLTVKASFHRYI